MNVANLDLCKALYEVSGWKYTHLLWDCTYDGKEYHVAHPNDMNKPGDNILNIPAYDLGYLLRKLRDIAPTLAWMYDEQKWAAITDASFERQDAATPEDAACKLCIELFKQGILQKEVTR